MEDFFNMTQTELRLLCSSSFEVPELHAPTLMREAYRHLEPEPWLADGLPKSLARLGDQFTTAGVAVDQFRVSKYDSSVKFIARMVDGSRVETVLMPETSRLTVCLSSQVGCAQACSFCQTGRMGLKRHLTAGEIVGQVVMIQRWLREHPEWLERNGPTDNLASSISNIVFMGMGEPLDNVDELVKAIGIMTDPLGLGIPKRKISVSTAGHLPGIKALFEKEPRISLALSLHAADDQRRSQLMPINRRWPIRDILSYLGEYYRKLPVKRHVLIQYTVISGVNDGIEQAKQLVELLKNVPVKVNLIPLNEISKSRFLAPESETLMAFRDYIHNSGIRVMVRYSKGQDIDAACGQLITNL
ncbi:MAG: 23S rRNA (adenine(2503)-C(2))-methyltransferase RlmN [Pseudobacteriovorax sp.]|nr:23S rRNA (adenine(2503)-C(2))-methyltransferase RlmN [Pseudobacteriovorax sp.]